MLNDYERKAMAEMILLQFIQHWGQSELDRLKCINGVLFRMGLDAKFVEDIIDSFEYKDQIRAAEFAEKLFKINRGEFYDEVKQISSLIAEYEVKV